MDKYDLREYKVLYNKSQKIREELLELRSLMAFPKNQDIDGTSRGGSVTKDKIGNIVCRIEYLEKRYATSKQILRNKYNEIYEATKDLDEREQKLIRLRYIKFKSWSNIARALNCSERNVHRLHKKILKNLENFKKTIDLSL